MYLYLYDSFLNKKKYNTVLARIETRLTDLGIGGKIFRLSPLRNVEELVADEIRGGTKTIVVVGNDKTLNQIVNISARHDCTIGLIPIGPDNTIARIIGIPESEAACNVLAARMVKKIDLGKINNVYFLSGLQLDGSAVTLHCENQYVITPPRPKSAITICNLRPLSITGLGIAYFNPEDGLLEVLVQPPASGLFKMRKGSIASQSVIPFKKLLITSRGSSTSVLTDGQQIIKTPASVEVAPRKLRLIVGKERRF
ncbi:MAG: hypothetical protein A3J59_04920 [Candidatus Buchananbacteria bacterium RIFCSPHIGHO2_02_FULL_56_16]|uniref:DAGKc domain-containing protein n=1 Tax=Candidatus Buchananbacteria bacterium RIFCSPHIGHO2_02_FULL_56_16 TaxID=1797542 RepID=A0A1G1YH46_9BACT|nr:MAG: hypothetical protein A3J59_04920 [Candidatus Buchananbacteria bacterium RIFCSPHIGHO2_02_FULL_56_16]